MRIAVWGIMRSKKMLAKASIFLWPCSVGAVEDGAGAYHYRTAR